METESPFEKELNSKCEGKKYLKSIKLLEY